MRPRFITDLASLEATVQMGVTLEDEYLEFKQKVAIGSNLPEKTKIENRIELCRDVSQFANTDGGCLLIGVSETRSRSGIAVAQEVVGVQDAENLRQQIEDTLNAFLVPSTFRRTVVPVDVPKRGVVLAVNVPASDRPVIVWNHRDGSMACYRRSSRGKVAQNPSELEGLLMDKARAVRLRLQRLVTDSSTSVTIHSGVWAEEQGLPSMAPMPEQVSVTLLRDYRASISVIGESEFTITLCLSNGTTLAINIPYGFVEEVWLGESGAATLSLTRKLGINSEPRLYLERRPMRI
ncbi:ATP-binding protein [Nannocystis pusilla]|uniref:ATP-binding protein n=1 Tax=Nannocystis pusilla TaxID=889268 RepID=A0A9X3J2Q3_9BACT|nr:ATP-binding protein [Nannocystis pusilla]MCY1012400.1 ATP-binding protein [Nannocystis pusilla]